MEGGGSKRVSEDMERLLIQWIFNMRGRQLRVSRKMVRKRVAERMHNFTFGLATHFELL